jgi:trimethylamine--corrinoid protein Co-methyltransferase
MEGVKTGPKLKILTEDQIDEIHEASLLILGRTGVRYDSPMAVERLVKFGAVLKPDSKDVVTFPRSYIEDSLKKIPRWRTYFARNPKNDIAYDGEHLFAGSLGGNPSILDLDTGQPRASVLEDVESTARVMDALPNCSSVGNAVVATEVPAEIQAVKTVEALMKNTSKCVFGYSLNKETIDVLVDMWAVVAGGHEELRKRPLLSMFGSPSSPLTYDRSVCEVMVRSAEHGVPVDIVPCPMAGGTAPVTLAGGLAQQNAELLAGIMLVQTVDQRLPTCYSGRLSILDLRTGANLWGGAEMALASAATVQIAHRYHIGCDVYGVTSDAPSWGMQMGLERMMTAVIPAMAGADALSGIGGAWGTNTSYEMLVIDNEIYGDVFRAVQGIEVDRGRLALDVIDKVGHMGTFLSQMHTMDYLKKGEIRTSPLWDKRGAERAWKEGIKPLEEKAREEARRILKEHEPERLDKDVEKELARVVKEASKSLM